MNLLSELARLSREEDGCIYYDFYDRVDEKAVHLFELWKPDTIALHEETPHFLQIIPQLLKVCSIEYIKKAEDAGDILLPIHLPESYIRLIVEVAISSKHQEDKFLSLASELTSSTRNEEGCISYTYAKLQDLNDYLFVEVWKSLEALNIHQKSGHCLELIPQLDQVSKVTRIIQVNKAQ